MASRYAVGSSFTWDASSSANWSASSGGAGGASVPTSSDDVFLNASSPDVTLGASDASVCKTLACAGYTHALDFGANNLNASGNVTFASGMTLTYGSAAKLVFHAAGTLTSGGKDIPSLQDAGAAAYTIALGDDLLSTAANGIQLSNSFNASNHNVTAYACLFNAGTLTMGSGTWTITGVDFGGLGQVWDVEAAVTLSAGTSTLKLNDASSSSKTIIDRSGNTYHNIWLTGAGTGSFVLNNGCTFANFKIDTAPKIVQFPAGETTTVASFTALGSLGNPIQLFSSSGGNRFTLSSAGGPIVCAFLQIIDSAATGGATWIAANSTDFGNNTGWIFGGNVWFGHAGPIV